MTNIIPKIAVQLVTYWSDDGEKDIERCLHSLERLQYPKDRWALVIVDNPSPNGSASEYIQKKWLHKIGSSLPEVFFVKNLENTGFAGGHNRAFIESKKWGADAVFLLNQDAVVDRGAIAKMAFYAQQHPNEAIVQSRVMLFDRPELLNSQGNCLHFLGYGFADGNGKKLLEADSGRSVFYASGAALFVRTQIVDQLGGLFDSRYFMYHEDVDLSWRARLAGHKIGVAMDSIVYHRYEFLRSVDKFFFMERNRFITHLTHLKFQTLLLLIIPAIFSEMSSLMFAVKNGWLDKKLFAYKAILSKEIRQIIIERRNFSRSIRVVKDRDIIKQMVGVIESQEVYNPIVKYIANPALGMYHRILKLVVFW